jgi:hypothetical protein
MAQASNLCISRTIHSVTKRVPQNSIHIGCPKAGRAIKHKPSHSQGSTHRYYCDVSGCTVTFTRSYDLTRHKRTIHGPKLQCPHWHCGYSTARNDKMKEHNKKKHQVISKFIDLCRGLTSLTGDQMRPIKAEP